MPRFFTADNTADKTSRAEINERSTTAMSNRFAKFLSPLNTSRLISRAFVFSTTTTRGSLAIFSCSRFLPMSTATTWRAPCCSAQSVKPPVEAPTSSTRWSAKSRSKLRIAASNFNPPRLTYFGVTITSNSSLGATIKPCETAIAPFTETFRSSIASCACATSTKSVLATNA